MVEVNGIGFSNKAIAFRVTIPDLPCANAKPHITICTINGGKPVDMRVDFYSQTQYLL